MTFPNKMDEKDAEKVVDEALDNGVNFIDTADSYQASEEVLGRLLDADKRDKVFLASKVYRRFCRDGRLGANSRVNILNNIDRSLRRLNTDYLDLYLLHHPDPRTPVEETLRTLDDLVTAGKIRYWGVSNHYAWHMSYMLGLTRERHLEPLAGYQAGYSILDRQIEQEAVPMMSKFNIGLMVYSPLCGGILTGKYHPDNSDEAPELPKDRKAFKSRIADKYIASAVHELKGIARELDITLNHLAYAWLLKKSWVSTILLGGSKAEQFTSLYDVADMELPDDVEEKIDKLSEFRVHAKFLNHPMRSGPRININM